MWIFCPFLSTDAPKRRAIEREFTFPADIMECRVCGSSTKSRCSRCRLAFYCSTGCQTTDWPLHMVQCRAQAVSVGAEQRALPSAVSSLNVDWPVRRQHLVIAGYTGKWTRRLAVCPAEPGTYLLLFAPERPASILRQPHQISALITATLEQPCVHKDFDLAEQADAQWWSSREMPLVWSWKLFALSGSPELPQPPVSQGSLRFPPYAADPTAPLTFLIWSCNQPFAKHKGRAVVGPLTEAIFAWYAALAQRLQPTAVMGLGDTVYTDSDTPINWVNKVLAVPGWTRSAEVLRRVDELYRETYWQHWSFPAFREVLHNHAHIFTWDDHEIRDGWGSEPGLDASQHPLGSAARRAAELFVLGIGPRLRPGLNADAHQAFVLPPVAMWIFDTRSSRHYNERIVSEEQWVDFAGFLKQVATDRRVSVLLLSITVPLIYLRLGWERALSEMSDLGQELLGCRDDARDSWRAPGNELHLARLIELLRQLHTARPALPIIIISGDIHVANAFSFQPAGFSAPLYQGMYTPLIFAQ